MTVATKPTPVYCAACLAHGRSITLYLEDGDHIHLIGKLVNTLLVDKRQKRIMLSCRVCGLPREVALDTLV